MEYKEITVVTTHDGADLVSFVLMEEGSQGVEIKDRRDVEDLYKSNVIWDYIDEKLMGNRDENVYVKGFFAADFPVEKIVSALEKLKSDSEIALGSLELTASVAEDSDWLNVWRKYYKPIEINRVVIVPKWIDYKTDLIKVLIEPGNAFGTGSHETTSMCIELMQDFDIAGKNVIDVGCGSGILGITAAKLGARECLLYDIDEDAVHSAAENIALNNVTDVCRAKKADLLSDNPPKADILLANITADILIKLSADMLKAVKNGGVVIVSGIINACADDVKREFEKHCVMRKNIRKGEWQAFAFELCEE